MGQSHGSSEFIVWRLTHPNSQTARCTILFEGGHWSLRRWLDNFDSRVEHFDNRDNALARAGELRRDLERRGFREDL